MLISRRALLWGAVASGVALQVRAEDADAPLDLQTAKRVKAPAEHKAVPALAPDEIVSKANDFLNSTRFMSADFVQIGPDGTRSEGLLVVQRPGHMLFRYKPPQHM